MAKKKDNKAKNKKGKKTNDPNMEIGQEVKNQEEDKKTEKKQNR